jgi:hypothetical protein
MVSHYGGTVGPVHDASELDTVGNRVDRIGGYDNIRPSGFNALLYEYGVGCRPGEPHGIDGTTDIVASDELVFDIIHSRERGDTGHYSGNGSEYKKKRKYLFHNEPFVLIWGGIPPRYFYQQF